MDTRGYRHREKHPLYQRWCWHKRSSAGMVPEWREDFWKFVEDVGEEPEGCQLRRIRAKERIGPGNFRWQRMLPVKVGPKRENRNAYMREFRKQNPRIQKDIDLKRRFGISLEQYERMVEEQGGGCAICGEPEPDAGRYRSLCVDHCHDSLRIRGILCQRCNRAIGLLRDDPALLRRAADYLS